MFAWAARRLRGGGDASLTKVFVSAALETIGWSIITPGLPSLHQTLELSSASVGNISALISMIALLSVVIQGMASDAMGRVLLLSISSLAQLVGHVVLYCFAKGWLPKASMWLFVTFRVLPSIFKCGMIVSQAYVCDWIYNRDRDRDEGDGGGDGLNAQQTATKHISTLMAYTNVGFIVGPILGGQLSAWDPAYPFSAGIVVFLLNLALLSQMQDPPREAPPSSRAAADDHDPESGGGGGGGQSWRRGVQLKSSIRPRGLPRQYLPITDSEFRPYLSAPARSGAGPGSHSLSAGGRGGSGGGNSSIGGSNSSSSSLPQPSLWWLLHVKFSFQIGNAIYESLFGQHLKDMLGTSSQDLGWLLGLVGLEAAVVNGVLVRFVLAVPARMWPALIVASLVQGVGLWLWALCASFSSAAWGAALIALSSNTFLSILQGLIALHSDSAPASSTSSSSSSSSSSNSASGKTFGLSTSIDRAARTVAPLLGGAAMQYWGIAGFAATSGLTGLYSAAALTSWAVLYGGAGGGGGRQRKALHNE